MASWSPSTYVGVALDEQGRKMTQCDRILWTLKDGAWHSHHEFYGWCVLHSRISELRQRGHEIAVRRQGGNYMYRLLDNAPPSLGPGGASSSEAASTLQEGTPAPGVASLDSDVQQELDWIDKQILWAADGPLTEVEQEPRMLEARHAYIDRLTRERARLEKLL